MRKIFTLSFLMMVFLIGRSQTTDVFTTSGSFTVPAGVTSIFVEAWGSGGSGGGALGQVTGSFRAIGGAGGGGAYNSGIISVTPGDVITYTVAPQTLASSTTQVDGSSSIFSTVSASGGVGGVAVAAAGAHIGGAGGSGGMGLFNGGNGGSAVGYTGTNVNTQPGGGGGGGTMAAGGNGQDWNTSAGQATGGIGGVNDGGNGASGRAASGNVGVNGLAPGGGGSGAYAAASATQRSGGAGARGQIRITYSAVVLPIKLESFTASSRANTVNLNWKVSTEINISTYEVERSANVKDFTSISTQSAINITNYSFIDDSPLGGFNYYRLKIVENDGSFSYSAVQKVKVDGKSLSINAIYPNPAINNITVSFNNNIATDASIQIIDFNGRVISTSRVSIQEGLTVKSINVSNLTAGFYMLRITTKEEVAYEKFIKL